MSTTVTAAEARAMGTTVRVVVDGADPRSALALMVDELEHFEQACSRFRADSDLSRVNDNAGRATRVDPLLVEAVEVTRRGARVSDGHVDPTIGTAIRLLGYDRDFDLVRDDRPHRTIRAQVVPGWQCITVDRERSTVKVPTGVCLDLGATAKAFAADCTATHVAEALGCGVLVSLGGDIAIAGPAPVGGWPVRVTDDHAARFDAPGQTVSIDSGGVATSSVTVRRWYQGEQALHHLLDPTTGLPVAGPFRTVSVAAATCVDANIATTAALVIGAAAPEWLGERSLPARLVHHDGRVLTIGGWPAPDGTP